MSPSYKYSLSHIHRIRDQEQKAHCSGSCQWECFSWMSDSFQWWWVSTALSTVLSPARMIAWVDKNSRPCCVTLAIKDVYRLQDSASVRWLAALYRCGTGTQLEQNRQRWLFYSSWIQTAANRSRVCQVPTEPQLHLTDCNCRRRRAQWKYTCTYTHIHYTLPKALRIARSWFETDL